MTDQQLSDLLEYYLRRRPQPAEMLDARDWLIENPGGDIAAYVEEMIQIGAL